MKLLLKHKAWYALCVTLFVMNYPEQILTEVNSTILPHTVFENLHTQNNVFRD